MESRDTYNVVVLGAMNPRIHHPMWYRLVGLLTEDEADAAVRVPGVLVTAPFSQFETDCFTVVCREERWEIRTSDLSHLGRLYETFLKVFDEILPHTPISVVGFNFILSRETKAEDASGLLAQCILQTPLGFRSSEASSGEIAVRGVSDGRPVLVSVKSTPEAPRALLVTNNYEYRMKGPRVFKLADELAGRYEADKLDALERTIEILEAVNRLVRA